VDVKNALTRTIGAVRSKRTISVSDTQYPWTWFAAQRAVGICAIVSGLKNNVGALVVRSRRKLGIHPWRTLRLGHRRSSDMPVPDEGVSRASFNRIATRLVDLGVKNVRVTDHFIDILPDDTAGYGISIGRAGTGYLFLIDGLEQKTSSHRQVVDWAYHAWNNNCQLQTDYADGLAYRWIFELQQDDGTYAELMSAGYTSLFDCLRKRHSDVRYNTFSRDHLGERKCSSRQNGTIDW
jgi:hypothetical protein